MSEIKDWNFERVKKEAEQLWDKQLSKIEIKETDKVLESKGMLASLLEGHEILIREVRVLTEIAERDKDGATVDLLARRMGVHEKMAWFLRNHLV